MGMQVCLESRVAMRVLVELGRFPAGDAAALYEGVRAVEWRGWLDARHTLAVSAAVSDTPALAHSGFAALKVKDAIVDAVRDALGARPNVDARAPDVSVRLHLDGGDAKLYLDLAGEPLHRRGYRVAMTDAPLKETLAAAVLVLGRVDLGLPFWDPMAGSGTLAIEHALAARSIAPGLHRRFGFERWPAFARGAWERSWSRLVDQARGRVAPSAPALILCSDRFSSAIAAARQNAAAAGVAADLTFEIADVREARPRTPTGNLVMNPPYGERLMGDVRPPPPRSMFAPPGVSAWAPRSAAAVESSDPHVQQLKLVGLYRGMAEALRRFPGWGIVVLSGTPTWSEPVPWQPQISHKLWNGPIETRLLRYEMPADGSPPVDRAPPRRRTVHRRRAR